MRVPHLYYLALGRGTVEVHEILCGGCESVFGVRSVPYTSYSRRPKTDIVELIAATNPHGIERHNVKLELEDRVDRNALSPDERLGLIAEPLMSLEYIARKNMGKGALPPGAIPCILLLLIAVPMAVLVWAMPNASPSFRVVVLGVIALLSSGTYLSFRNGGRGWLRRFALPRLARSLAPLQPTHQELESVLSHLARQGSLIGQRIRTEDLLKAVEGVTSPL